MTATKTSVISKLGLVSVTFAIWLLICFSYELHRIAAILALPPSGDLYAYTWGFQLMTFVIFRFPVWIAALIVIYIFEIALLTQRTSRT